jgi:hypothetical protein
VEVLASKGMELALMLGRLWRKRNLEDPVPRASQTKVVRTAMWHEEKLRGEKRRREIKGGEERNSKGHPKEMVIARYPLDSPDKVMTAVAGSLA